MIAAFDRSGGLALDPRLRNVFFEQFAQEWKNRHNKVCESSTGIRQSSKQDSSLAIQLFELIMQLSKLETTHEDEDQSDLAAKHEEYEADCLLLTLRIFNIVEEVAEECNAEIASKLFSRVGELGIDLNWEQLMQGAQGDNKASIVCSQISQLGVELAESSVAGSAVQKIQARLVCDRKDLAQQGDPKGNAGRVQVLLAGVSPEFCQYASTSDTPTDRHICSFDVGAKSCSACPGNDNRNPKCNEYDGVGCRRKPEKQVLGNSIFSCAFQKRDGSRGSTAISWAAPSPPIYAGVSVWSTQSTSTFELDWEVAEHRADSRARGEGENRKNFGQTPKGTAEGGSFVESERLRVIHDNFCSQMECKWVLTGSCLHFLVLPPSFTYFHHFSYSSHSVLLGESIMAMCSAMHRGGTSS
jgi:hypothetical protein